jgi:hypothetical protein
VFLAQAEHALGLAEPEQHRPVDLAEIAEPGGPEVGVELGLQRLPCHAQQGADAEGGLAEAAVAVAPGMIPRDAVSNDVHQILGCADLYAAKHGERVVFFSDLTGMFTAAGTSWTELGVDWEAGLRELADGLFPLMFLTVSERAYLCICGPAARLAGGRDDSGAERERARQVIGRQLVADWRGYMGRMIAAGRVRLAG